VKERMTTNNPMQNYVTKQKMIETRKKNGSIFFKVRGGNGRPLPKEHHLLLTTLQSLGEWKAELPVVTGQGKYSGYPSCYKLDIGHPQLHIGIEIDGASHASPLQRMLDLKKENLLEKLGWKILRFKNHQITDNLNLCVEKVMYMISQ
jgi:hypothetical protein